MSAYKNLDRAYLDIRVTSLYKLESYSEFNEHTAQY